VGRVLAGSIPAGHPRRRWQSSNAAGRNPAAFGHRWCKSIPAHASPHGPGDRTPASGAGSGGSSPPGGTMARLSLARLAACKAVTSDGPIPSRASISLWPRRTGQLPPKEKVGGSSPPRLAGCSRCGRGVAGTRVHAGTPVPLP
jgi:hypothetical protein